jgi:GTP-binding protein EngB required for normal cell division
VAKTASSVLGLSARLTALGKMIQVATARTSGGGFSEDLIQDAQALVERAGERLRLSAGHTVAALAGGTGSGKSSLFNRLAGADFSAVGVTRPVTREAHVCVWGAAGSGPLVEWLGVPRRYRYARGSALDGGEQTLNGLVLLDLPDHDSVVGGASGQVERLVGMADLMVWVLDPQKYADASVHRRYLVPLAGHSAVIAVVLNQSDLLSADDIEDCVGDLRRLLDSEGLQEASVFVTSAITGAGIEQLRKLLAETVSERRATASRISADLDGIAAEFAPYAQEPAADGAASQETPGRVPSGLVDRLVDAFSRAVGVSALGDALQSARELRAMDYVGWPIAWLAERLSGSDPVRKIRLGRLWTELRSMTSGPTGAQQAEIDSALTKLADDVGGPLPKPWSQTTRSAVRSKADQIPAALGTAIGEALPDENKIATWWRFVGALQGLLLGCVIVSLVWIVALLIFGVGHAAHNVPRLFSNMSLLPVIIIMIAAFLILGWLTATGCLTLVKSAAGRERDEMRKRMRDEIGSVTREMVVVPTEQELAEYESFRTELRAATGELAEACV